MGRWVVCGVRKVLLLCLLPCSVIVIYTAYHQNYETLHHITSQLVQKQFSKSNQYQKQQNEQKPHNRHSQQDHQDQQIYTNQSSRQYQQSQPDPHSLQAQYNQQGKRNQQGRHILHDKQDQQEDHGVVVPLQKPKDLQNSIFLLKTHKTGGSVIQNILLRRVASRNLTIALSDSGGDWSRLCITKPFQKNCVCNKNELPVDVIAHHMIFNDSEVKATLKKDAKFISILRDPVTIITSGYTYFGWEKQQNFTTFGKFLKITERSNEISDVQIPYRNLMTYAFGLKPTDFDNEEKIRSKLAEIESTFDLIMINDKEHFHQSLILLKDLMHWSFEDMAVLTINKQLKSHHKPVVTDELKELLLRANHADIVLYNKFVPIFVAKVEKFGADRMKAEIEELIRKTEELKKFCIAGTKPGQWNTLDYILTRQGRKSTYCRLMASNELDLTRALIHRYNTKAGRVACPVY